MTKGKHVLYKSRCEFICKSGLFWQIELFVQAENMLINEKVKYIKCKSFILCVQKLIVLCTIR